MRAGRLVSGASGIVLMVALAGCTSESAGPIPPSTEPTTPATTTTTTTVAPRPTAVATPTTAMPGGCPSGTGVAAQNAVQAARCLHEAWKNADRPRAAVYASLDVVDALLAVPWSAPDAAFKGCAAGPGAERETCTFAYHGADYVLDVRRSEGGWRVTALPRPPRGA